MTRADKPTREQAATAYGAKQARLEREDLQRRAEAGEDVRTVVQEVAINPQVRQGSETIRLRNKSIPRWISKKRRSLIGNVTPFPYRSQMQDKPINGVLLCKGMIPTNLKSMDEYDELTKLYGGDRGENVGSIQTVMTDTCAKWCPTFAEYEDAEAFYGRDELAEGAERLFDKALRYITCEDKDGLEAGMIEEPVGEVLESEPTVDNIVTEPTEKVENVGSILPEDYDRNPFAPVPQRTQMSSMAQSEVEAPKEPTLGAILSEIEKKSD